MENSENLKTLKKTLKFPLSFEPTLMIVASIVPSQKFNYVASALKTSNGCRWR
jgi:hypothetical protein